MNPGPNPNPNPVDVESLIRAHLLARERAVDPRRILAGVRSRQAEGPGRSRRPGGSRPRLGSITVAIDERTKLVRQVVLARLRAGRPLAEVSFTGDGAGSQPDPSYRLASHLAPDAVVYGHDQRLLRRRALVRFFGSLLLKGE